ncbi:unnamed protein product [Mycena citricolor]|uniref:Uncharacterized protein n=1 Tax=Mycena citricolor TaxID=2018698 RepID=A0AAD2H1F8_9AGAR|nr:unnamed protein product [Mycena citricolor]
MYAADEPENPHPLFKHEVSLKGPKGERVRGIALFDGAAGAGVLDSTWFAARKHRLGKILAPRKRLRMANGAVIPSSAHWEGPIDVGGVVIRAEFEVIDSGGAWNILLGKPLLRALRAVQDFRNDTVLVADELQEQLLHNTVGGKRPVPKVSRGGWREPRREASVGDVLSATSPPRRVQTNASIIQDKTDVVASNRTRQRIGDDGDANDRIQDGEKDRRGGKEPTASRVNTTGDVLSAISPARRVLLDVLPRWWVTNYPTYGDTKGRRRNEHAKEDQRNVHVSEAHVAFKGVESCAITPARRVQMTPASETNTDVFAMETHTDRGSLFTRLTEPFKAERVQQIVALVELGPDISAEERETVRALVAEYADIFALAVSEVKVVPGRKYSPRIPDGHDFGTKTVNQRPMSPPQLAFLTKQVDELVAAGILRHIDAKDVRCVSPITMAPKDQPEGICMAELLHQLNNQCVAAGLPGLRDIPARPDQSHATQPKKPVRWRVCHNFAEINRVCKVVPFPQGDI